MSGEKSYGCHGCKVNGRFPREMLDSSRELTWCITCSCSLCSSELPGEPCNPEPCSWASAPEILSSLVPMGSLDEEAMTERMGRPREGPAVLYSDHERNRCHRPSECWSSWSFASALSLGLSVAFAGSTKQEKGRRALNIKDGKAVSNLQIDSRQGPYEGSLRNNKGSWSMWAVVSVCTDVRASMSGFLKGWRFS